MSFIDNIPAECFLDETGEYIWAPKIPWYFDVATLRHVAQILDELNVSERRRRARAVGTLDDTGTVGLD